MSTDDTDIIFTRAQLIEARALHEHGQIPRDALIEAVGQDCAEVRCVANHDDWTLALKEWAFQQASETLNRKAE